MPLYTRTVSVPPQTAEDSAVTVLTEVEEQVITEASVYIDPGSNGEVRVELLDGESNIIPEPQGDPISKPGETGPVPLDHQLPGVPSTVTVKVWATDADFEHEVKAQWETQPPERANPIQRIAQAFSSPGRSRPAGQPPDQ
jgi:hypothetical protein